MREAVPAAVHAACPQLARLAPVQFGVILIHTLGSADDVAGILENAQRRVTMAASMATPFQ